MATKKKALSPAECDRWDTIPGTTKTVGKNTPTQQKAVDEINAVSDLRVAYEPTRTGRIITHIKFSITKARSNP